MAEGTAGQTTLNWNRAIFIDQPLNDEFVRSLAPSILRLRQESSEPITVGIDSPGGSLATLDTLIGLLTGPTQDGARGSVITVVTNRAYSAAANLLAFGNYSVALAHSRVICHDVRYGEIEDVTPSKARDVAKSLQEVNDAFALRLANHVIQRLVWIYLDLFKQFDDKSKRFAKRKKLYQSKLGKLATPIDGQQFVDIAGFATTLFALLSTENDVLIDNVMDRLGKWIILTGLAEAFPTYRAKGSRRHGLLDGPKALHKDLTNNSDCFGKSEADLKLLLTLLVAELPDSNTATRPFISSLDDATRNFVLIQSMSDKKHRTSATRLMLRHEHLFFGRSIKELDDDARSQELSAAMPNAQLFWLFCVSLCRELFEGEHTLKPIDAQLLGLVDEVAGGGPIETKREYRTRRTAEEAEKGTGESGS